MLGTLYAVDDAFTILGIAVLLVLVSALEKLHARPFLATWTGRTLAWLLGAKRAGSLYEVGVLPAFGFVAAGQTWGETVLVVRGHASPRLLAHEACLVRQYRRLTSLGFWLLYAAQWCRGMLVHGDLYRAYWEIPLEAEAREAASRETG